MRAVVFCFGLLRLMILQLVECLIRRLVVMFERHAGEQFLPESAVLLFFSCAVGALGKMSGGLGRCVPCCLTDRDILISSVGSRSALDSHLAQEGLVCLLSGLRFWLYWVSPRMAVILSRSVRSLVGASPCR